MAEIIRPFSSSGGNAETPRTPQPPLMDPKVLAFRAEIEKLEEQRADVLAKYEDTRRALEKQRNVASGLVTRLKRTETLLAQEQARLRKANEIIGNYQKQWTQMVQSEQKLRAHSADSEQKITDAEKERLRNQNDKNAALNELGRIQAEFARQTKSMGELQTKHHQIQEMVIALEKRAGEEQHRAAVLEQELEGARASLATAEKNQTVLRNELSDARFRIEQLKRDVDAAEAKTRETEKLLRESMEREESARSEIATLNSEALDLTAALKIERDALATARTKLADAEAACENLLKERTDLVKRGDTAYAETAELKKRIEEISREARETETDLKAERDRLTQAVSRLEAEICIGARESDTALATARAQIEALTNDVHRLHSELKSSTTALESERAALQAARDDITKSERLYEQLMKERADLVRRGDLAYDEVARLNRKLDESVAHGRGLAETLRMERDTAQVTIADLESQLSATKFETRRIDQERLESGAQRDAFRSEIDRLEQELSALHDAMNDRDITEENLHRELQDAQQVIHEISQDRAKLQEENVKAQSRLQEAIRELLAAKDEVRIAHLEMDNIRAAVSREVTRSEVLEQERDRLERELLSARHTTELEKTAAAELAERFKTKERNLTRKLETEESAREALWGELVKSEEKTEKAQIETDQFQSEIDALRQAMDRRTEGADFLAKERKFIESRTRRAQESRPIDFTEGTDKVNTAKVSEQKPAPEQLEKDKL